MVYRVTVTRWATLTATGRNRATEEQKRKGWAMALRIERNMIAVLDEAHLPLVVGTKSCQ